MKTTIPLLLVILTLSACARTRLEIPTSHGTAKYDGQGFGTNKKFGAIEFRDGTNVFRIEGYESDQTQALGIVAEKTAAGVAKALKP